MPHTYYIAPAIELLDELPDSINRPTLALAILVE
jgi:hypothetical protein